MTNFRSELSWERMKDLYIRVYSETFTQEEIDAKKAELLKKLV